MDGVTLHTHSQLYTGLLVFHPDFRIPGEKDDYCNIHLNASSGVFLTFPLSKLALSPYPQLLLSMLSSSLHGSLLSVDLGPFR